MGANLPLLSILIWLPIFGGLITFLFGDRRAGSAKYFALAVAVASFLLSIQLYLGLDQANPAMQFAELAPWLPGFNINYSIGVDGISVALIMLTTFTSVLVLLGSWSSIENRTHQYFAAMLVLEGLMIGVFSRHGRDTVLHFLRRHADSDVHHHRHLGRPAPRVRQHQVLPVYLPRFGVHADRPDLPVPEIGQLSIWRYGPSCR